MLWRHPGRIAPRVSERQVCSLVDLAPTLLAMAGLEPPAHMAGQDLGAVLRGERETAAQAYALIEIAGGGAGLRSCERMHALAWRDGDQRALDHAKPFHYDLRADPFELSPLQEGDAQATAILERWVRTTPWKGEAAPALR
jgi:arylsulfatase A-like enzyme